MSEFKPATSGTPGYEDADPGRIAAVGVLMSIVVVAAVIALQGVYSRFQKDDSTAKADRGERASLTRAEQSARISAYAWIDEKAGVAAIPVEQAMELVVNEARAVVKVPAETEGNRTGAGRGFRSDTGGSDTGGLRKGRK
jgi:hypothetical protein